MEPGPTEFDTGRSWFLLSCGCNRSRYYRVAHGAGPIPNETQFRCRTLGACLQTTANQKPRKRVCGGGTSSACNASLALDLGGEGDGWGPSPTDTPPSGRSGGGLRRPVRLPGVPTAAPPTSGTVPYHSATATHPPPPAGPAPAPVPAPPAVVGAGRQGLGMCRCHPPSFCCRSPGPCASGPARRRRCGGCSGPASQGPHQRPSLQETKASKGGSESLAIDWISRRTGNTGQGVGQGSF